MIPKIVHLSWKTKCVVDDQSDIVLNGLRKLIDLNPDWDVQISTDDEVNDYLKINLPPEYYMLVKNIGIVPQTDIWRLIKLFKIGGVYVDIDRLCNKSLNDLLEEGVKWVLPTCEDNDFSHDFMMTAANNPAFANVIKLYFERRAAGYDNVFFLGAQTYMHGITHSLVGEMVNTNPGKEKFDWLREKINNAGFISTYRESLPNNTVIYKGSISAQEWEGMKRSFYANSGVKHWTNEW
jgi:mannosyltransferase OCH1-like enzyme